MNLSLIMNKKKLKWEQGIECNLWAWKWEEQRNKQIDNELQRLIETWDKVHSATISMQDTLKIQEEVNQVWSEHDETNTNIDESLNKLNRLNWSLERFLREVRDTLKRNTDTKVEDMKDKLNRLLNFLKPKNKVNDSIKRPQSLKEMLDDNSLHK